MYVHDIEGILFFVVIAAVFGLFFVFASKATNRNRKV
jgi:hypothetical protein